MKLSIATIQDFLLKQKAHQHEAIKQRIEELQTERYALSIHKNTPPYKITIIEKKIEKLQKKLLRR